MRAVQHHETAILVFNVDLPHTSGIAGISAVQ